MLPIVTEVQIIKAKAQISVLEQALATGKCKNKFAVINKIKCCKRNLAAKQAAFTQYQFLAK